ncbi:hypothetical protein I4U23_029433 [Adineta vaga]|nr:hypothetical protein I4U23_029433 [Adineta vaga]
MSDVAISNQLPPRTTTSTRWPRKWSTLGGRCTSSSTTVIPTNESDAANETSSKTNGHHRHSASLHRKASTMSRTNGAPAAADETSPPSLKKSRSLMNVLRSKLNSPAVIRRFRSKSRENSKQTITEINGHTTNEQQQQEQQQVKQANDEEIVTSRKSRKRDPSPMRRLANRISQLTRHQSATAYERQKKSPIKSSTNDDIAKTSSPIHNKDTVDHINACYDEIRAKYFTNNNLSNNDHQSRSLLSNDLSNNTQRMPSPILPDDPLLQARKQANLKLNCLLSGYTLTTPFSTHEKSFGRNDLFKFNHYYDVGKRKYDWNSTNANNQLFSNTRARPFSKSIDSFRPPNVNEDEVPITLEKMNIADNDRLVRTENHQEDVPKVLPDDNEVVIQKDIVLNKSEPNSSNIHVTPSVPVDNNTFVTTTTTTISTDSNEDNIVPNEKSIGDRDEEFEQNFLRAVDRALGVVNKDERNLIESSVDDLPKAENQSSLNLMEMTERALSSVNNLPDILNDNSNDDKKKFHNDNVHSISSEEVHRKDISVSDEQPLIITEEKHDESAKTEQSSIVIEEKYEEPISIAQSPIIAQDKHEEPMKTNQLLASAEEKHDEPISIEQSPIIIEEKHEESIDAEQLSTNIDEKHNDSTNSEQPPIIVKEQHDEPDIIEEKHAEMTDTDHVLISTEEKHNNQADVEQSPMITEEKHDEPTDADQVTISTEENHDEFINNEQPAIVTGEKQEQAINTEPSPTIIEEKHDEPTNADQVTISTEESHDEFINNEQPAIVTEEKQEQAINTEPSPTIIEEKHDEPTNIQQPSITTEEKHAESTNNNVNEEDIVSVIEDLVQKTEGLLVEESKNGQTFLAKLDDEEKTIKSKADSYNNLLGQDDNRLSEDVHTDINAVIGEVNLLLRGKLKQFRSLCEANVTKSTSGEPIPLDSDLEGFWDITYPLIDKVKEKFTKLDTRKAKQWAPIEEYDPNDINNRPRVIDDRLKLQPQQNKSSKIPLIKSANVDLKRLIQERRKAAANSANQNHDIEIFVAPK